MNGVTAPVIGFTVTIRELLFCPPPWVDWLESVAKSRPPERPLTKAMSIAGPAGWNPPPLGVGLPKGPRISVPIRLNTRMSGVKGYASDTAELGRRVADDVHQILNGAKLHDIPI